MLSESTVHTRRYLSTLQSSPSWLLPSFTSSLGALPEGVIIKRMITFMLAAMKRRFCEEAVIHGNQYSTGKNPLLPI
jgi:hypothetical protein